jgi:uncharacterized protein YhaN
MRLEELHLDGFGHFHQRSFPLADGPVTVFYGPNEAGKTTLLAFIRTILFGFPRQGRNAHYPPLAGGSHGGRIRLSGDGGEVYILERYSAANGGRVALRAGGGEPLDANTVLSRITGQATPNLFNSVFAFSIDELQEIGALNETSVSGAIYSAGQGVPGLPALSRSLGERRGRIFTSGRGRAQEIPRLVNELRDIDGKLGAIEGNAGRYRDITARKLQIEEALRSCDEEQGRLNARQAEVNNLKAAREDWIELTGCEAHLETLPRYERFPDDPIPRLEGIEERARGAGNDVNEAVEQLKLAEEAVAAIAPEEGLLEIAARIEEIRRGRTSYRAVHDLPERQEELRALEETLAERLRGLGDAWDETNLDVLDLSITTHAEVDNWKSRLVEAIAAAAGARIKAEQERDRVNALRVEEQEAQSLLQGGSGGPAAEDGPRLAAGRLEELLADRERLEQIRRGRGSFDASVRDLPERRAELGAMESDLLGRLRDMGQGWDERRLDSFDTSIVFRQEVEGWKETLASQGDQARQARERLEQERERLSERQTALREARERAPDGAPKLDSGGLIQQRAALRSARSSLDEYERARVNRDNLQGQLVSLNGSRGPSGRQRRSGLPVWPVLLAVAALLLAGGGVFLGGEALIMGLASGLALLAAAVYFLSRGRTAPGTGSTGLTAELARQEAAAGTSMESARSLLLESVSPLGIDGLPTPTLLGEAETRLESAASALSAWGQANDRVAEAERFKGYQEQRLEEASQRAGEAVAAETGAVQGWRDWLEQRQLPINFNPDTMIDFMGRLETARARLEQVRQMRHRVSAIEVDIHEYLELVQPVAQKHGVALDAGDHQGIASVSDTLIQQFDAARGLADRRDDAARRLKLQEQAAVAADDEHGIAETALAEARAEWGAWLTEHGLREEFDPDTTLEFMARVETARASLGEVRRMRSRVAAIEKDLAEFQELVATPAQTIGLDPGNPSEVAAAADSLIDRLDQARQDFSRRATALEQQEETQRAVERQTQRLQAVQQELDALLAAGEAADQEDFRRRARQHQERQELERHRGELERGLERLSGPGEKYDAFRESLADTGPDRLDQEAEELSLAFQNVEAERTLLLEERGGLDNELERLTGEEESSRLRTHRETLVEQLRECAREWSKLAVAEALLEKTRQKFEEERQPRVIQHAQEFFSHITGQRYERLFVPIGDRTVTVMDGAGGAKQPGALSRGTREQLYLALRFGLVREFGEHAERLPVVVDEVLVNFDPERARLAAEAFAALSETNQVLVFTCHPGTAGLFAEAAGAQVIEVEPAAGTHV